MSVKVSILCATYLWPPGALHLSTIPNQASSSFQGKCQASPADEAVPASRFCTTLSHTPGVASSTRRSDGDFPALIPGCHGSGAECAWNHRSILAASGLECADGGFIQDPSGHPEL